MDDIAFVSFTVTTESPRCCYILKNGICMKKISEKVKPLIGIHEYNTLSCYFWIIKFQQFDSTTFVKTIKSQQLNISLRK